MANQVFDIGLAGKTDGVLLRVASKVALVLLVSIVVERHAHVTHTHAVSRVKLQSPLAAGYILYHEILAGAPAKRMTAWPGDSPGRNWLKGPT